MEKYSMNGGDDLMNVLPQAHHAALESVLRSREEDHVVPGMVSLPGDKVLPARVIGSK